MTVSGVGRAFAALEVSLAQTQINHNEATPRPKGRGIRLKERPKGAEY